MEVTYLCNLVLQTIMIMMYKNLEVMINQMSLKRKVKLQKDLGEMMLVDFFIRDEYNSSTFIP